MGKGKKIILALVAMILYDILPDPIPGPVDDFIVTVGGSIVTLITALKKGEK